MTNKEKYKKAFSAVYPSDEITLEVEKMKKLNNGISLKQWRRLLPFVSYSWRALRLHTLWM